MCYCHCVAFIRQDCPSVTEKVNMAKSIVDAHLVFRNDELPQGYVSILLECFYFCTKHTDQSGGMVMLLVARQTCNRQIFTWVTTYNNSRLGTVA